MKRPRNAHWLRSLALLLTTLAAGLVGCAGHEVENPTPLDIFVGEATAEPPRYIIQPGDQLDVRFFHTPEHNAILPVRPDGFISLPLAPEVRAAGQTAESLRNQLQALYERELKQPQIAVIVLTFSGYKIHVGGEVQQPGIFDLTGGRTVLQAIFEAGGFLPTASPPNVVVVRRKNEGGFVVAQLDLQAVMDGTGPGENIALRPYDVVFVPRSAIANVNLWVDQYIRQNIPFSLGWRLEF